MKVRWFWGDACDGDEDGNWDWDGDRAGAGERKGDGDGDGVEMVEEMDMDMVLTKLQPPDQTVSHSPSGALQFLNRMNR